MSVLQRLVAGPAIFLWRGADFIRSYAATYSRATVLNVVGENFANGANDPPPPPSPIIADIGASELNITHIHFAFARHFFQGGICALMARGGSEFSSYKTAFKQVINMSYI